MLEAAFENSWDRTQSEIKAALDRLPAPEPKVEPVDQNDLLRELQQVTRQLNNRLLSLEKPTRGDRSLWSKRWNAYLANELSSQLPPMHKEELSDFDKLMKLLDELIEMKAFSIAERLILDPLDKQMLPLQESALNEVYAKVVAGVGEMRKH